MLLAQVTFYFLGYLRPSIIYDYTDYWPITILPIVLITIFRRASFFELLRNILNIFLIVVILIFSFGHLFDSKFLTTYKFDSFFQNNELSSDFNYSLLIDIDGKLTMFISYNSRFSAIKKFSIEEIILFFSSVISPPIIKKVGFATHCYVAKLSILF